MNKKDFYTNLRKVVDEAEKQDTVEEDSVTEYWDSFLVYVENESTLLEEDSDDDEDEDLCNEDDDGSQEP